MTRLYFALIFKIMSRKMRTFGLHPIIAVILILFGLYFLQKYYISRYENSGLIILAGQIVIMIKNNRPKKTEFLQLINSRTRFYMIRFLENILISCIAITLLILNSHYIFAGIIIILSGIFSLIHFNISDSRPIPSPFQKHLYEYSVGYRKTYWLYPVSLILMIAALITDNTYISLLAWFIPIILSVSYYTIKDEEIHIWNYSFSTSGFIWKKLYQGVFYITIISIPYIIILMFLDSSFIITAPLILIMTYFLLMTTILSRYASYPQEITVPYSILILFSIFLPPLFLFTIPFFYIKSQKKLSPILK